MKRFLCLVFLLAFVASDAGAVNAAEESVSQYASAPIVVRRSEGRGYEVELLSPLHSRMRGQLLLSIDGQNLSGQTLEQIRKKLEGPAGSTLKVELLYQNGECETFELVRAIKESRGHELEEKLGPSELRRCFQNLSTVDESVHLLENSSTNADLVAKAFCAIGVRSIGNSIQKQNIPPHVVLLKSFLLCQSIGDFDSANKYLSSALEQLKSEKKRPDMIQVPLNWLVKNLVAIGKFDEAQYICDKLLEPSGKSYLEFPRPFSVLVAYTLIPSAKAKSARLALADKLFADFLGDRALFQDEHFWLANYLESTGANEKALQLYSSDEQQLRQGRGDSQTYSDAQLLAYCLYCKARVESILGRRDKAAADLDAITDYFQTTLKPQQLTKLDLIPGYFPKPEDLSKAKSALSKSLPIAAAPHVDAMFEERSSDYDFYGNPVSISLSFKTAIRCFDEIKANDKKGARASAEELLRVYIDQNEMPAFDPVRQNLFCTLLRVARAFADKQWYEASDQLLNNIGAAFRKKVRDIGATEVADAMINAELAYNAGKTGSLKEGKWGSFQNTYHLSTKDKATNYHEARGDVWWSERLRLLAMAYYYADEPNRAKFIIADALAPFLKTDGTSHTYSARKNDKFLLYADAACIFAKSGDMPSAEKYFQLANLEEYKPDTYTSAVILELALTFDEKSETAKAVRLLEDSRKKLQTSQSQMEIGKLDMLLTELLKRHGQTEKSAEVVRNSIASNPDRATSDQFVQAAEASEKGGQFAQAAKYYQSSVKQGYVPTETSIQNLRKSVACALRAKNYPPKELANLYVRLAEQLEFGHTSRESLQLREKALALLKDTDPEKPALISLNEYIRNQLRKYDLGIRGNALDRLTEPTADELSSQTEAARLASLNKLADESHYWLRLATVEARLKKVDLAVAHARQGIAAYSQKDPAASSKDQMFRYDPVPQFLVEAGAPEKAKEVFKAANSRVEEVNGVDSMPAQAQMAQYFEFLVKQKDFVEAERTLNVFLRTNLGQGYYSPPNHSITICRFGPIGLESSLETINVIQAAITASVTPKDNRFALRAFSKILEAERKQFGGGDRRTALTMVCIASAHAAVGENSQAYATYNEALEILKKYEPMHYVLNVVNPTYYDVLRKLNKQSEIDSIQNEMTEKQMKRAREADIRESSRR